VKAATSNFQNLYLALKRSKQFSFRYCYCSDSATGWRYTL